MTKYKGPSGSLFVGGNMQNSRLALRNARSDEKPHNSSKGKGIILEQPYKPGFVDDKDLETVKMAVDKELGEIANAFYETTEKTADTITRIERLEIGGGTEELRALIEQVDKVSKENDVALAQRITTVEAESSAGLASVKNEITAVSDKLGTVEAKWGLTVEAGDVVGSIQLGATAGGESEFRVRADKFVVSNGSGGKNVPFEIVGNNTRIKSLFVTQLQSDNWDNTGNVGWAVKQDGSAWFQNVNIKGNVKADSGYFNNGTMNTINATNLTVTNLNATNGTVNNMTIAANCNFLGTVTGGINVADQAGNVGLKITNQKIEIFDENGRLRVRLGRLT